MSNYPFETKISRGFVTKIDEAQGIVEAFVNIFGILDDGGDVSVNGCAVKSIAERGRRLKVLNSHNSRRIEDVIGVPLEAREAGRDELPQQVKDEWPEATGGLFTRTQYLLDTPEGLGAFNRIKANAVNEYSIGYEAVDVKYAKFEWRGETVNARFLKQIRWWEYSPVVWGMNPATATSNVKSDKKDESKMGDVQTDVQKEMTPQGPVSRIGDMLQGQMRMVSAAYSNSWLAYGKLSTDQLKAINQALETAMATFVAALPEEIALMPTWGGYYMMDSAEAPNGQKAMPMPLIPYMMIPGTMQLSPPTPESKTQAVPPAEAKATDPSPTPGAATPEEKVQAGPSSPETPTPQAGPSPSATPTEEERQRILKSIESDLLGELEKTTT